MANRIPNATFLDALDGVTLTNATGTVDESVYGAPGRAVLVADATAAGATTVAMGALAVTAGQQFHAFAHTAAINATGAQSLALQIRDGGGAQLALIPLALNTGDGRPRRGLPGSFDFWSLLGTIPATGTARLLLSGSLAIDGKHLLLKPLLEAATVLERQTWQPGPHTAPDLNLPSWPTQFSWALDSGLEFDPIPTRKAFDGDTGVPITRRVTSTLRYKIKAEFILTMEERDQLGQFFDAVEGLFWFTRPDTQEVCQAAWLADGEPKDGGLYLGRRRTQVGLFLRVT